MEPRPVSQSQTTMTEIVLPTHANAMGNVFGGQVLAWMDVAAAICAQRHCGTVAVTAGIDDLSFEGPVKVGHVIRLEARLTAAFRSSVEVSVEVRGEDANTGRTWPCVQAFMSFVAIDSYGKPVPVPPLLVEHDAQRTLAEAAAERRAHRLKRAGK